MKKIFFIFALFASSITLSHEDHKSEELKYILHKFSPNSVACEGSLIPQCEDLGYPHMICSLGYLVNENRCESMFKDFPNGQQPKNSVAYYDGWTCDVGYTKKNKKCVSNVNKNDEVHQQIKVVEKNELILSPKNSEVFCDKFSLFQNNEYKNYPQILQMNFFYDFKLKKVLQKYSYKNNENKIIDKESHYDFIIDNNTLVFFVESEDAKIFDAVTTIYNISTSELIILYKNNENLYKKFHLKSDCSHDKQLQANFNKNINSNKAIKKSNETSQVITEVLNKDKIKEELKYYKELFEEKLIEKSEYDELRKALLSGLQEGSVTKTIIVNKPDEVAIQSQNDIILLKKQLELEKRKVEAMENQASSAEATNKAILEQNKIIEQQAKKNRSLKLMQKGFEMLGGNTRTTNCYNTLLGFKCSTW